MIALTHVPSPAMQAGERTHIGRETIDHSLALQQHAAYRQTLEDCGAKVIALDCNANFPDGTFIEDTAVILDEVAVLASLGAPSRRGEVDGVAAVLASFRELVRLDAPATLEGGDVLRVGKRLIVGQSGRSNAAGIEGLAAIARPFGYAVESVEVFGCLHLKTACTALPDGRLLMNGDWIRAPRGAWRVVRVPGDEPWGANTLLIEGHVVASAAHPKTAAMLRDAGFSVQTVDLSEFAKAEGGVTCLSLLVA